jgi:hypothetical protein
MPNIKKDRGGQEMEDRGGQGRTGEDRRIGKDGG